MSLITTCPACHTSFHLKPEHLNVKRGYVRCGHCQHAFNAIAFMQEIRAQDISASDTGDAHDADEKQVEPILPFSLIASHGLPADAGTAAAAAPEEKAFPALEPLRSVSQQPEAAYSAHGLHPALGILAEPPRRSRRKTRGHTRPSWPWLAVCLLLLLLAGTQAAMHYRSELLLLAPRIQPVLVKACTYLGCKVELPRQAVYLSIDDSDLREDEQRAGVYILTSKISNLARYALAYPQLELTLTDVNDRPLTRRILLPEEYLPSNTYLSKGFPASSQIEIKVFFRTDRINASGYRVFVNYPGHDNT